MNNRCPGYTRALSLDADRCIAESLECRDLLVGGNPEQRGLRLGIADWVAEEVLIRDEVRAAE